MAGRYSGGHVHRRPMLQGLASRAACPGSPRRFRVRGVQHPRRVASCPGGRARRSRARTYDRIFAAGIRPAAAETLFTVKSTKESRFAPLCLFYGDRGALPLLLPKQVFRPASFTALALRSVQPVPREDCCPLPTPPLARPREAERGSALCSTKTIKRKEEDL